MLCRLAGIAASDGVQAAMTLRLVTSMGWTKVLMSPPPGPQAAQAQVGATLKPAGQSDCEGSYDRPCLPNYGRPTLSAKGPVVRPARLPQISRPIGRLDLYTLTESPFPSQAD